MSTPTTSIFGQSAPQASQPLGAPPLPSTQRLANLLDRLKSKKVGERQMPAIIALESNKGGKSINATALPLKAGKSRKGTAIQETPGLPLPPGPVSMISYDHQSEASLQSYYGDTQEAVNKMEVIPIRQLLGFNTGNTKTAEDVVDGTRELLKSWASEKRAMIIMDRWDELTEHIIKLACFAKAKLPSDASLVDRGVWNPRKPLIFEIIDLLVAATLDGGVIILTGSEEKDEGAEKVTVVNGKTIIAAVPSKWVSRVEMHLNARITVTVGKHDKTGETIRLATVHYSRYAPIPENVRARVDGRHLGALLDKTATQSTEKDFDHAPLAVLPKV